MPYFSGPVIYCLLEVELTVQQAPSKSFKNSTFSKESTILHKEPRRDIKGRKVLLSRHAGNELIITSTGWP